MQHQQTRQILKRKVEIVLWLLSTVADEARPVKVTRTPNIDSVWRTRACYAEICYYIAHVMRRPRLSPKHDRQAP
jgi:hypothetical protein